MSEADIPEHLEEITTKERIKLVSGDPTRRIIQLVVVCCLIVAAICYVGYYALLSGDSEFAKILAQQLSGIVLGGVGAAFAVIGLGRTVGRK